MNDSRDLVLIDKARQALAEAKTLPEILKIRDQAEALRQYIKAQRGGLDSMNMCAAIKLMAERKSGALMAATIKHGGDRKGSRSHDGTLKSLGITRNESSRWQTEAKVPEATFIKFQAEKRDKKEEITQRGLLKLANQLTEQSSMQAVRRAAEKHEWPTGKYPVIVVDPPWKYDNRAEDTTHRARNPYPAMSVDELKAIAIPAAGDCVLWLWTTNAFMRQSYELLDAWGFTPKTILTWDKEIMGLGDWLRGITEHCHLAVKGKPRVKLTNQTTLIREKRTAHSVKPAAFYELVEKLCVGPRLEMFAREARKGWESSGVELRK